VNPAARRLTGYSDKELTGRKLDDFFPLLFPEESRDALNELFIDKANEKERRLYYLDLRNKRGETIPVEMDAARIISEHGHLERIVLTLRDVTILQEKQTELEEAYILLDRIFDNTHMCIAYLDTDFRFKRVNKAYADSCGCGGHELLEKKHFDLFPHDENEYIFRQVLETGIPYIVHAKPFVSPLQPDGDISYWDWSLQVLRDADGEAEGLLLCLLDVTQQKRSQRARVASERKYRELVQNARNPIIRLAPNGTIRFLNEYAQHFYGYEEREVVGKPLIGTLVPDTGSEGRDMRSLVNNMLSDPESHDGIEYENICRDGRRVWVYWSNRGIFDEDGNLMELLCVGTDMTAQRVLQKKADDYQRRLRRLSDRLIKLEEEERRKVATHIHDTIIQTISLSNIRLGGVCAKLCAEGHEEQSQRIKGIRALLDDGIRECRQLMGQLVPSLLYEFGLGPALRNLAERQQELDGTPITVEEDDQPKPMGSALRSLLFQCAREMINNALKHAGPCEIHILISRKKDKIYLQVSDNGKGFDVSRLDEYDHHSEGGFGLFNIRERLESLGGRLELESAPGKGTWATIVVPMEAC
jgi:PAS domain S-box-containing protein